MKIELRKSKSNQISQPKEHSSGKRKVETVSITFSKEDMIF